MARGSCSLRPPIPPELLRSEVRVQGREAVGTDLATVRLLLFGAGQTHSRVWGFGHRAWDVIPPQGPREIPSGAPAGTQFAAGAAAAALLPASPAPCGILVCIFRLESQRGGCQGGRGPRWPLGSRLKMDILFVTIKTSDFSFINF